MIFTTQVILVIVITGNVFLHLWLSARWALHFPDNHRRIVLHALCLVKICALYICWKWNYYTTTVKKHSNEISSNLHLCWIWIMLSVSFIQFVGNQHREVPIVIRNLIILIMYQGIFSHYNGVIMSAMASQINSVSLFAQPFVQTDQRKHQSWPMWGEPPVTGGFPSQRPVTRKVFPFNDVIMTHT